MVRIEYSVSHPYSDIVFVEMYFFDNNIKLAVEDPLVKPIYDILLRYDLRGDLGFPMSVTAGANLKDSSKVNKLLECFNELETEGYVNATNLRQELMNVGYVWSEDSSSAPRCSY